MWVIFTHTIADNSRRFSVWFVWCKAKFKHRIQDSSLNRFQPIFNSWQRSVHNNVFGIRYHRVMQNIFKWFKQNSIATINSIPAMTASVATIIFMVFIFSVSVICNIFYNAVTFHFQFYFSFFFVVFFA